MLPESPPITLRVLVTAGPTEEPIDDVRFIGNRSSGKMGCAIANAFVEAGHQVTLLLGPVCNAGAIDPRVCVKRFRSAQDLNELMRFEWPSHTLLIMSAAVADFRPSSKHAGKLRRGSEPLTIELTPVPDLVAALGDITSPNQRRVAFALEVREGMLEAARRKLRSKGVDGSVRHRRNSAVERWDDARARMDGKARFRSMVSCANERVCVNRSIRNPLP